MSAERGYGIYGDPDRGVGPQKPFIEPRHDLAEQGRDAYGGDLFGDPGAFDVKPTVDGSDRSHRKVTEAQKLGFHRDAEIPEIPEGKQLVKVAGEPAVISQAGNEPTLGNSAFTEKQLSEISRIVEEKRQVRLAESGTVFQRGK